MFVCKNLIAGHKIDQAFLAETIAELLQDLDQNEDKPKCNAFGWDDDTDAEDES